ncbi:hypothetical protein SDC9_145657 [bioreactor metagenome]|uniref:Uncharacterized protein n=1 Tax=bioreactor metagenome TaxID=1076179 RepID=A0A645EAY1_9ZZZZ
MLDHPDHRGVLVEVADVGTSVAALAQQTDEQAQLVEGRVGRPFDVVQHAMELVRVVGPGSAGDLQ